MHKRDPLYALGLLEVSLDIILKGMGDSRQRLLEAYNHFHPIHLDDFPESLRDDWKKFIDEITRSGAETFTDGTVIVGAVENTMRHTRKKTASRLIGDLEKICNAMKSIYDK